MRQIYAYLRLSFPSAFTWNSLVPSHGIVLYIALDSHDTASEMGLPWFRPVCVSTYFSQLFIFNFKYFVACLSRMNTFCILTFHTSKPRFPAIPSRVIWLSMSQSVPTSRNSWIEVPYFMNTFSPHFTRGRCTREWLPTWPSRYLLSAWIGNWYFNLYFSRISSCRTGCLECASSRHVRTGRKSVTSSSSWEVSPCVLSNVQ